MSCLNSDASDYRMDRMLGLGVGVRWVNGMSCLNSDASDVGLGVGVNGPIG
ncbi:MAG TPA: hypothetical protein VF941_10170 [Clostridia bacterium]